MEGLKPYLFWLWFYLRGERVLKILNLIIHSLTLCVSILMMFWIFEYMYFTLIILEKEGNHIHFKLWIDLEMWKGSYMYGILNWIITYSLALCMNTLMRFLTIGYMHSRLSLSHSLMSVAHWVNKHTKVGSRAQLSKSCNWYALIAIPFSVT